MLKGTICVTIQKCNGIHEKDWCAISSYYSDLSLMTVSTKNHVSEGQTSDTPCNNNCSTRKIGGWKNHGKQWMFFHARYVLN